MPVLQFSGKYLLFPGKTGSDRPHIDLMLQNATGRTINDFHVYTVPTSIFVDTPDFTRIRMYRSRRLFASKNNRDADGSATADLDDFTVRNIDPPIEDGEPMRFHFHFDQPFDGDEGIVIVATSDGAVIGSSDSGTAGTPIPEGPSVWDVTLEALKAAGSLAPKLLGRAETPGDGEGAWLASVAARDRRFTPEALRAMAPAFAGSPSAVGTLLAAADGRRRRRGPLVIEARPDEEEPVDDDGDR